MTTVLFALLVFSGNSAYSAETPYSPSTSTSGAATSQERAILWNKGVNAFNSKDYETAATLLQRYVDRYPGQPNYLQAHEYLGRAWLRLNKPRRAIPILKYYIEGAGESDAAIEMKLHLAEAYFDSFRFEEALMTVVEILVRNEKKALPAAIYLRSILIKVWSQIELGQMERAIQSLASYQKESEHLQGMDDIKALGKRVEVELKLRQCEKSTDTSPKGEVEVKNLLEKRSQCLLESLILFNDGLSFQNRYWTEKMRLAIHRGFYSYFQSCQDPPPGLGKKTEKQKAQYRKELIALLNKDCRVTKVKALELLDSWEPKAPAAVKDQIGELQNFLKNGL